MRALKIVKPICLTLIVGSLIAQNLPVGKTQQPQLKKEFYLTYYDIRESIMEEVPNGLIQVEFVVDEEGKVTEPHITDTFDIRLNDTILDKVLQVKFKPALQNGKPVKVRYKLPILFK